MNYNLQPDEGPMTDREYRLLIVLFIELGIIALLIAFILTKTS